MRTVTIVPAGMVSDFPLAGNETTKNPTAITSKIFILFIGMPPEKI